MIRFLKKNSSQSPSSWDLIFLFLALFTRICFGADDSDLPLGKPTPTKTVIPAAAPKLSPSGKYVPDEILIKFKSNVSKKRKKLMLSKIGTAATLYLRKDVFKVKIKNGMTVEEVMKIMGRNAEVEYAEPNYVGEVGMNIHKQLMNKNSTEALADDKKQKDTLTPLPTLTPNQ